MRKGKEREGRRRKRIAGDVEGGKRIAYEGRGGKMKQGNEDERR